LQSRKLILQLESENSKTYLHTSTFASNQVVPV
jgi:hypothetical protein